MGRRIAIFCVCLLLLWLATGCSQPWAESAPPTATPSASESDGTGTTAAIVDSDDATSGDRQLVLWLPDSIDLSPESPGGSALLSVFSQFEDTNPNVHIDAQIKDELGPSSLFNYLRSSNRVAPSIVPDLFLVDTQELWQLGELGVVKPLPEDLLASYGDFYPFVLDSVTFQDEVYGLPFIADVIHLARFTGNEQDPLQTWQDLLSEQERFLFPVGGQDIHDSESLLLQYVGAGGQLVEDGALNDLDALEVVLRFVEQARTLGIIPPIADDLASMDSVWSTLIATGSGYANVSSHRFLSQREFLNGITYGQVPTNNGAPTTLGRTWALVLLTEDPDQQALALSLIDRLMEPSVHGAWSQAAHRLPTRPIALEEWTDTSDYHNFLGRQLDVAVSIPNGRAFAELARRLQAAQYAIVTGEKSAEEALLDIRTAP